MQLLILERTHALRTSAEDEVRRIYRRTYGAEVDTFPELLAALVGADGKVACAAGVRFGLDRCFCEQYLDEPVEDLLGRLGGARVARSRVLEVTTLAGDQPRQSMRFLRQIVAHGRSLGMEWGLFTATRSLRSALPRLSLPLVALAPARRERVADPEKWGNYYETDPWVCAMPDRSVVAAAKTLRPSTRRVSPINTASSDFAP